MSSLPRIILLHISTRDHLTTWESPISVPPYQYNSNPPPLTRHHRSLTPLTLSYPHHACQITFAASPSPLPKYLLACSSGDFPRLSDATTSLALSPLPQTPSLMQSYTPTSSDSVMILKFNVYLMDLAYILPTTMGRLSMVYLFM